MKNLTIILFSIFYYQSIWANLTTLKIDSKFKIKYDQNEWNYLYLKPTSNISSNVLSHKDKKFHLVLSKETHLSEGTVSVQKKCSEADNYYKNLKGNASIEIINSTPVCYINYLNSNNKKMHLFVYPGEIQKNFYELYTFAWKTEDQDSKTAVKKLLIGFLK